MKAAEDAFSNSPSLPLSANTPAEPAAQLGRKRLAGAFLIEVTRVRPDPQQPRRNPDDTAQEEINDSVRRIGILQPITVRYLADADVYQVISGERRYQAALAAGLTEIPCWVQSPKTEDILLHQIVENWLRADLHPFDLADALASLRDAFGHSQRQLAELTGKPESEISRLLSLHKLNPAVQQTARRDATGTYTRRHLAAVAQLAAEDQQEVMIAVREQRLNALDTERVVQERKAKEAGVKRRGAPVGQRYRYKTTCAVVTLTFRRGEVTKDDVLSALDEARAQVDA